MPVKLTRMTPAEARALGIPETVMVISPTSRKSSASSPAGETSVSPGGPLKSSGASIPSSEVPKDKK